MRNKEFGVKAEQANRVKYNTISDCLSRFNLCPGFNTIHLDLKIFLDRIPEGNQKISPIEFGYLKLSSSFLYLSQN